MDSKAVIITHCFQPQILVRQWLTYNNSNPIIQHILFWNVLLPFDFNTEGRILFYFFWKKSKTKQKKTKQRLYVTCSLSTQLLSTAEEYPFSDPWGAPAYAGLSNFSKSVWQSVNKCLLNICYLPSIAWQFPSPETISEFPWELC